MRRALQVVSATLLVAGVPVAAVWWLRASATVTAVPLALLIGMGLSLLISWAGQHIWEKQPGSEDLLFNELMVWGYLRRQRRQRRLASVAELVRDEPAKTRRQQRLLEELVARMETRDPYLHGHSRRVARYAWMIAQQMKLSHDEVAKIRTAAALHDVGKSKTPKTILHKPGRLTDEEYRVIKLHPGEGAEMVAVLGDPQLEEMIRHHHERLDGSGYPDGLAGRAIPLGARIISVADTFDAITSARPYRPASPQKRAIDILRGDAGSRLDPVVVRAFCDGYSGRRPLARLVDRLRAARPVAELAVRQCRRRRLRRKSRRRRGRRRGVGRNELGARRERSPRCRGGHRAPRAPWSRRSVEVAPLTPSRPRSPANRAAGAALGSTASASRPEARAPSAKTAARAAVRGVPGAASSHDGRGPRPQRLSANPAADSPAKPQPPLPGSEPSSLATPERPGTVKAGPPAPPAPPARPGPPARPTPAKPIDPAEHPAPPTPASPPKPTAPPAPAPPPKPVTPAKPGAPTTPQPPANPPPPAKPTPAVRPRRASGPGESPCAHGKSCEAPGHNKS